MDGFPVLYNKSYFNTVLCRLIRRNGLHLSVDGHDWAAKLNEAKTKTGYSNTSDHIYLSQLGHRVALEMCPNDNKMTGYV